VNVRGPLVGGPAVKLAFAKFHENAVLACRVPSGERRWSLRLKWCDLTAIELLPRRLRNRMPRASFFEWKWDPCFVGLENTALYCNVGRRSTSALVVFFGSRTPRRPRSGARMGKAQLVLVRAADQSTSFLGSLPDAVLWIGSWPRPALSVVAPRRTRGAGAHLQRSCPLSARLLAPQQGRLSCGLYDPGRVVATLEGSASPRSKARFSLHRQFN